jgi:outer membrane protein assembly factor BamB
MNPKYAPNGNELSSPAVAEGIVYVNSFDYNLYAFNASTGEKIANFTIIQPDIDFLTRSSSPAVAYNTVYVGIDGTLYAINISSFSITKSLNLYILEITAAASVIVVACLILGLLLFKRNRVKINSQATSP